MENSRSDVNIGDLRGVSIGGNVSGHIVTGDSNTIVSHSLGNNPDLSRKLNRVTKELLDTRLTLQEKDSLSILLKQIEEDFLNIPPMEENNNNALKIIRAIEGLIDEFIEPTSDQDVIDMYGSMLMKRANSFKSTSPKLLEHIKMFIDQANSLSSK